MPGRRSESKRNVAMFMIAKSSDAFERGFVELARVTRIHTGGAEAAVLHHQALVAEDHAERAVGLAAPEFAVDEVGDAAKEQANGRGSRGEIAETQKIDGVGLGFFSRRFGFGS
jgi:hypothetical protein